MGTRIGRIGQIFTDFLESVENQKSVKIRPIRPIRVPIVIQQASFQNQKHEIFTQLIGQRPPTFFERRKI